MSVRALIAASALCAVAVAGTAARAADEKPAVKPGEAVVQLQLDPRGMDSEHMRKERVVYYPIPIKVVDEKPLGITKEPEYKAKPKYGVIRLGNGPKGTYLVALDEPPGEDGKIYVDANRNGDLTDDGSPAWGVVNRDPKRVVFGPKDFTLHASWGDANTETSSGDYGVALYRFPDRNLLFMYRIAARVGKVTLDGKTYNATLYENDADALFSKPLDPAKLDKPTATRPVNLKLVPADGADAAQVVPFDVRGTFKLNGQNFAADISPDGSRLRLYPTTRVVELPKPPARPELLAAGTPAPEFSAVTLDGKTVKLSDYRGKVVVLDFWATWCGPCQVAMPGTEKLYRAAKGQNVVVLGVCVWDEKDEFSKWVPANKEKYTFQFAFDPAGRDDSKSIASKLYKVSGIPTQYVIDGKGNVVTAAVGASPASEKQVRDALKGLGVKLEGLE